ncbi:FAR1-related sequence 10 [Tanacetum coccineum]|uniref:FAR1-related sequence 10 n=1 Tax=Tanacetum coccineum TaxID=301880 RepID=A0ABQ5AID0_9ASTR
MYYHFKIPNNNLDHGLQALGNDADVMNLVRYIDKYILIEVFIEHEYTVLETYLKSLQKLRLEEIVDDVESSALARKPFKKPGLKVNMLPQLLLEGPSLNDDVEVPSFNAEKEKETTDYAVSESNEEDVNKDENGSESNEEVANEYETGSESRFKEGLRDLFGLDGCFIKGQYPGQLLIAVGIDANHGIYPLAYAIVETEKTSSWSWFLTCLGILPAIAQVFPNAEHRFCVRHIYENFKAQWKCNQFKELVWKCAAATIVPYFDKQMGKLKNLDEGAYEYLQKIPPQHWSRSHFSGRAHCPLTPAATKLFEAIKYKATFYTVLWNGGTNIQMKGHNRTLCKGIVRGSQASKVGGSQGSSVGGSKASSVRGSKASSVGVSKRTKGSQTGTSCAAKRSKLF